MINLNNNRIPGNLKKIHLIAICGTGMGALGCMLKDMGFEISGSDQRIYPPMSDFLLSKEIDVRHEFNEKNISPDTDLVIVGNAVLKDNPEIIQMIRSELNFCSMPQAINRFFASGKKILIITGTHGKTTTSSVLAWILYKAGRFDKKFDPSFVIGGILQNFKSNYRLGNGEYIVIEGDEYDTAFFDKGPKLLHYDPFMTVLTSVEFDHADIFMNLEAVKTAFDTFLSRISAKSTLFAFDKDKNIYELINKREYRVERYGCKIDSPWRIGSVTVDPPWTLFEVLKNGKIFAHFKTRLWGKHNLFNILAAMAIADNLQIPKQIIAKALESFQGTRRRQEVRGYKRGITVIDDFAHHPTAVRETIHAVKQFHSGGRLVAVFEPRTNTSMRKIFQDTYPLSFNQADIICIRKPSRLEKIPLAERFSSEKLVNDLKIEGKDAHYFSETDSIIDFIVKQANRGDIILIMSNGGFDNIHERLLKRL